LSRLFVANPARVQPLASLFGTGFNNGRICPPNPSISMAVDRLIKIFVPENQLFTNFIVQTVG
jgi:hypothetical protein